ncbi:serine hydrolase [Candidatus Bathyarchaeota archaeon]|nr:MAG: serine hydrolase [Candidatus Bathyarchaeota archaeon]
MSKEDLDGMRRFIEKRVPELMAQRRVPGLSIAVVEGEEVVYAEGFGVRDVERSLPATPDTLYGIGSCTKSFVALAILQLVERGEISLDDPVSKYIPLKIGIPGKPITVHHLLTHSSGIPSLGTSTIALSRGIRGDVGIPFGSADDFYRHINGAQEEIADEPGRRFFYLNAGYRMLGDIIQRVSEMPFDVYIREKILKPLKMERTTFSKGDFERDPDRMTPYIKDKEGRLIPKSFPYPDVKSNPEFSFIAAAGGMLSSVRELTNYLRMNIDGGRFGNVELLSPELMEEMQRIHIERPPGLYGRNGYGYGWGVIENFLGHKLVSHGGSILVSTAYLAFVPEERMGVAMASNIAGFPYAPIAQGIFAALMGKDPEEVVPLLRIWRRMDLLTGTYEIYRGLSRVKVVKHGGLLYLERGGWFSEMRVPLIPEREDMENYEFYIYSEGVKQPVEFVVESPEKIDLYIERNRYHKVKA